MFVLGAAAVTSAAEVQMQVQRVSLFKNGYSQVRLSGVLPDAAEVQVKNVPIPVFGTLRWMAPEGVKMVRVTGRRTETQQAGASGQWPQIAAANAGRAVRIVCYKDVVYEGVIVSPAQPQELPSSAFLSGEMEFPAEEGVTNSGKCPIVLRTEQGALITVPPAKIVYMDFADGAPRVPMEKLPSAELSAQLSAAAPGAELGLECMAWGMSWLPEYRLELSDNGKACLVGNIVVLNDLMDMEKVRLELVSGSPAQGESVVSSPLVRLVGVKQYLESISSGRDWVEVYRLLLQSVVQRSASSQRQSYDVYRSGASAKRSYYAAVAVATPCVADFEEPEDGERVEDLYCYSIPNFSCKCGEVVERELFRIEAPYEHVYICAVPDQHELSRRAKNDESTLADIWHCLRLKNDGDMPWSTGVVSCFAGEKLVARSMLSYTSAGRAGLLPLNKTLEAAVGCREELVSKGGSHKSSRKLKSSGDADDEKVRPDVYRGELKITNRSDREMRLELQKAVLGTPTEASDAGSIRVSPSYRGNPTALISWVLTLEPGASKTLIYTYEYAIKS